jgi:hypothetical protein
MEKNLLDLIDGTSQEDWEKTPKSVQQLVQRLIGRIEQMEQQYEELKGETQLLKERLK